MRGFWCGFQCRRSCSCGASQNGSGRRVGVESAARFPAEMASIHEFPQQRAAAILRIVKALEEDIKRVGDGVEADQIRGFQRPHLVPEALFEDLIDLLCGGELVLHHESRFVHENVRDAVGDEARRISDDDRLFLQLGEERLQAGERAVGSVKTADDLDRRLEVHRVHEMNADNLRGPGWSRLRSS